MWSVCNGLNYWLSPMPIHFFTIQTHRALYMCFKISPWFCFYSEVLVPVCFWYTLCLGASQRKACWKEMQSVCSTCVLLNLRSFLFYWRICGMAVNFQTNMSDWLSDRVSGIGFMPGQGKRNASSLLPPVSCVLNMWNGPFLANFPLPNGV